MTTYVPTLVAPDYRNLVINPGGEESIASTWYGSNGSVTTGANTTAPFSGTGVVEYIVTSSTSQNYFLSPIGPDEIQTHRLAFKIPESRTVSFRVRVKTSQDLYVRLHGSWGVTDDAAILASEFGFGPNLDPSTPMSTLVASPAQSMNEISNTVIGPATLVTGAAWTTLEVLVPATSIPSGTTHWRPQIAVFGANPTTNPTPPPIGVRVWADEALLLDSGLTTVGVPYFDGDSSGHVWENIAYYSSSRTTPPATDIPPDIPPPPPDASIVDTSPTEQESDLAPIDEIDNPPLPRYRKPAPVVTEQQLEDAAAERSVSTVNSHRNLSMVADFQIGDLLLNNVDERQVAWVVSDLEGWWTTPEPDVPDVPRAYLDGSFPTRGRYNARAFTLTGSFFPRYYGDTSWARDKLLTQINLCHKGGWFLTHEDPTAARTNTKGCQVWLMGQPLINTTRANGRTDFSIPLRAPDPIKYGIKDGIPPGYESNSIITGNVQYPERAYNRTYPWKYPDAIYGVVDGVCENRGTAWVSPIFHLKGPTGGNLRIVNTATQQVMRIVRKLYPDEVLEIDCSTKQVRLNGVGNFRFYVDLDTDWIGFQPGPNRITFSEEDFSEYRSEMSIMWRSGWIG